MSTDIGTNNKMFLLLSSAGKAAVIEYRYRLTEAISYDALIEATKDAVSSFPYFGLKPVVDKDGRLIMENNGGPMPVFKKDEKQRNLGSDDTYRYLFRVLYDDDEIDIEASHGIGDGRGIMAFSQTLIYYYLVHTGKSIDTEGMLYTKADLSDKTITDHLLDRILEITPVDIVEETAVSKIFCPTEKKVMSGTPYTKRLVLSWDFKKLMDKIKPLGASPLTFFHDLISSTMYEYYDVKDATVVADVPVDVREKLGSRAQSNFTINISIPIEREMTAKAQEERYKELKEKLNEKTKIEYLAYTMQGTGQFLSMIDQISLRDEAMLKMMESKASDPQEPMRSYLLSNIGLMKLPKDMMQYIKDFDIYFTNLEASPVFTMLTFGGRGMVIVGQNFEETGLINAVYKKLKDMDVDADLKDYGRFTMDDANVKGFECL